MTKTIPLEEVKKLATPGKLTVRAFKDSPTQMAKIDAPGIHSAIADVYSWIPGTPGGVFHKGAKDVFLNGKANAALLAHSWNVRDDLIEALEDMLEKHTTPQEPNAATRSADRAKAVLARAKEVEMP